jgi:leucyl aminopeptidase
VGRTGACLIALCHVASGLFSNDERLSAQVRAAGEEAWNRVLPMPDMEDPSGAAIRRYCINKIGAQIVS